MIPFAGIFRGTYRRRDQALLARVLAGALSCSALLRDASPETLGPQVGLRADWAQIGPEVGARSASLVPAAQGEKRSGLGAKAGRAPTSRTPSDNVACRRKIDRVLAGPRLPGAPELEASRPQVLLYAKGEPVLFVRPPDPSSNPSPTVRTYRGVSFG